jgi:hypothetical protein
MNLLRARIDALLSDLEHATATLRAVTIDQQLKASLQREFLNRTGDLRAKLEADSRDLSESGVSRASWVNLDERSARCAELFREILAVLQGIWMRRNADAEAAVCGVADKLLEELEALIPGLKWNRFTILSDRELFSDMTQIIRLRYPLDDIWDLPVAAHEFGHFLSDRLTTQDEEGTRQLVFQDYLAQYSRLSKPWLRLNEHIADSFAAYALGPAYACTCLLTRFSPANAWWQQQDTDHPCDGDRAYVILEILGKMNTETDNDGDFERARSALSRLWDEALRDAGQRPEIDKAEQQRLDRLVSGIYDLLERSVPDARYRTWNAATRAKQCLLNPGAWNGHCTVVNLLNAAWICRVQEELAACDLNRNFIAAIRGTV